MDTPFKNLINRLGVEISNEKLCKQALYNITACVLVVVCCTAVWGVFLILQPFLKPLFWALLCGSVLHPFKRTLSMKLKEIFRSLNTSSRSLSLASTVRAPFIFANGIANAVTDTISRHIFTLAVIACFTLLHVVSPKLLVNIGEPVYDFARIILFQRLHIFSQTKLVACLIILFTFLLFKKYDGQNNKLFLTVCSTVVWYIAFCYAATFLGYLTVPVFMAVQVLFLWGVCKHFYDSLEWNSRDQEGVGEPLQNDKNEGEELISTPQPQPPCLGKRRKFMSQLSFIDYKRSASEESENASAFLEEQNGDQYLYWAGWTSIFVLLARWWCTHYFIISYAIFIFIRTSLRHGIFDTLSYWISFMSALTLKHINVQGHLKDILFPGPLIVAWQVVRKIKRKVLKYLEDSSDMISTTVVICGVILLIVVSSMFVTMQIYAEGVYLLKVGSKMLNESTLDSKLMTLLPPQWQGQVDSALNNTYYYGRDFISSKVKHVLGDLDPSKAEEYERMVLDVWERVYQAWIISNDDEGKADFIGPKVTSDAVYQQVWDKFSNNSAGANIHTMLELTKVNVSTLLTALKHVGEFVADNMWIMLQALEAVFSIIYAGGFALLSFVIDIIIYFTALFYLMSSSTDVYKPTEFVSHFNPTYGKKLADAIERSVAEVFMVSLKLSVFYALYTWLLHNLFETRIVYVPTGIVLASVFAAVPILPTYLVCVPGFLDLWLLQGNLIGGLALCVFQFAPTSIVDATIYQDIHGGHPYLTGLSMAGGVLCFGIEGAITGPLILCCMLVVVNLCTSLLKQH